MEIDEYDDFGWSDYELEEAGETLIDTFLDTEKWFTYVYDFGNNWRHRVTIEKILEDYGENYAQVLKYKGETPYEDCGGIDEYYSLCKILDDPGCSEYEDMKGWTERISQKKYDPGQVNEKLKRLYLSDEESDPMTQNEIYCEILEENKPFKKINTENALPFNTGSPKSEFGRGAWTDWMDTEQEERNITLRDCLSGHKKQELMDIVHLHHMSGYHKFNKSKTVEYLSKDLLNRQVIRRYFCYLSENERNLLEGKKNQVQTDCLDDSYDTLITGGYAECREGFYLENIICVPEEVKEAYRIHCDDEWKKNCAEVQELVKYMNLATELYGICPVGKMLEIYKKYTGKEKNEMEIITFAEEIPENKKYFVMQNSKLVLKMVSAGENKKALWAVQRELDFYFPTQEETELLMGCGYLPFNDAMRRLQEFFRKNGEDTDRDAEALCKRVQFILRLGEDSEVVLDMLDECYMGFEDMMGNGKKRNLFLQRLEDVIASTRMMPLRGHTLEEINPSI